MICLQHSNVVNACALDTDRWRRALSLKQFVRMLISCTNRKNANHKKRKQTRESYIERYTHKFCSGSLWCTVARKLYGPHGWDID